MSFIINKFNEYINNIESFTNNNDKFKVSKKFKNYKKAHDILSKLNNGTLDLIYHLEKKYLFHDGHLKDYNTNQRKNIKILIKRLLDRYKPKSLRENVPSKNSTDTSYTINKGDTVAICLRHKNNQKIFNNYNDTMFCHLHEITHIANRVKHHTNIFWVMFKFLLQEAVEIGIYKPVNYDKHNAIYCGIKITYQPLYDNTLDKCC